MYVVSLLMQFAKWKWFRFGDGGALRLSANARLMAVFREHSNRPFLMSGASEISLLALCHRVSHAISHFLGSRVLALGVGSFTEEKLR